MGNSSRNSTLNLNIETSSVSFLCFFSVKYISCDFYENWWKTIFLELLIDFSPSQVIFSRFLVIPFFRRVLLYVCGLDLLPRLYLTARIFGLDTLQKCTLYFMYMILLWEKDVNMLNIVESISFMIILATYNYIFWLKVDWAELINL